MSAVKLGRNDPCPCGSGKKYKRCCLPRQEAGRLRDVPTAPGIPKQISPVEPHLDLLPSVVWHGRRWRAIFNTLHHRPEAETFHEFLIRVVQWTFGHTWWKHQLKLTEPQRHVVMRWAYAFSRLSQAAVTGLPGGNYPAAGSGPVWALLTLGYDLFCLQAVNKLPDFVIERLRTEASFQSARYEVAAAAIVARSGFDIDYLQQEAATTKHCEFIARHRIAGVQLGVEAKSRVRRGVLNEPGEFINSEDARGLEQLIRKARKQKPEGLPFLIFVDLNLPSTPGVPYQDRQHVKDIQRVLARIRDPSSTTPDPFNALVVTNYSFHFGDESGPIPAVEWGLFISALPETPLDARFLSLIDETLGRYGTIPREV